MRYGGSLAVDAGDQKGGRAEVARAPAGLTRAPELKQSSARPRRRNPRMARTHDQAGRRSNRCDRPRNRGHRKVGGVQVGQRRTRWRMQWPARSPARSAQEAKRRQHGGAIRAARRESEPRACRECERSPSGFGQSAQPTRGAARFRRRRSASSLLQWPAFTRPPRGSDLRRSRGRPPRRPVTDRAPRRERTHQSEHDVDALAGTPMVSWY